MLFFYKGDPLILQLSSNATMNIFSASDYIALSGKLLIYSDPL